MPNPSNTIDRHSVHFTRMNNLSRQLKKSSAFHLSPAQIQTTTHNIPKGFYSFFFFLTDLISAACKNEKKGGGRTGKKNKRHGSTANNRSDPMATVGKQWIKEMGGKDGECVFNRYFCRLLIFA